MAEERKLLAIPAEWPQPEFALGETVYDVADRARSAPIPGLVAGVAFRNDSWVYLVNFEGYNPESEFSAEMLTREAWEYTPAYAFAPAPTYAASDDFDPFLDSDTDLP